MFDQRETVDRALSLLAAALEASGSEPYEIIVIGGAALSILGLDREWLNAGPADLLDQGLPEGFEQRLTAERYGPRLTVWLPARCGPGPRTLPRLSWRCWWGCYGTSAVITRRRR